MISKKDILDQVRFNLDNLFGQLHNIEVFLNDLKKEMFNFRTYLGKTYERVKKEGE